MSQRFSTSIEAGACRLCIEAPSTNQPRALCHVPASGPFLSKAWAIALHKYACIRTCQLLGQTAVAVPIGAFAGSPGCYAHLAEVN